MASEENIVVDAGVSTDDLQGNNIQKLKQDIKSDNTINSTNGTESSDGTANGIEEKKDLNGNASDKELVEKADDNDTPVITQDSTPTATPTEHTNGDSDKKKDVTEEQNQVDCIEELNAAINERSGDKPTEESQSAQEQQTADDNATKPEQAQTQSAGNGSDGQSDGVQADDSLNTDKKDENVEGTVEAVTSEKVDVTVKADASANVNDSVEADVSLNADEVVDAAKAADAEAEASQTANEQETNIATENIENAKPSDGNNEQTGAETTVNDTALDDNAVPSEDSNVEDTNTDSIVEDSSPKTDSTEEMSVVIISNGDEKPVVTFKEEDEVSTPGKASEPGSVFSVAKTKFNMVGRSISLEPYFKFRL